MNKDFKKEFIQKTENGTMNLTLWKPKETTETNDVWGTIVLESELDFEKEMDLRITMEFGKRDHFNELRRRRYTLFGDPDDGNFTIFTLATEQGSKENLTDYRWWTSVPQSNKTWRYDFFEYPGSFYQDFDKNFSNVIWMKNNTAQFMFKAPFEHNEI